MIHYLTPYHSKDLGTAYNKHIDPLPQDSIICVRDLDTCILDLKVMPAIEKLATELKHGTGLITCLTNRIGERSQLYKGIINDNPDIRYHKKLTIALLNTPWKVRRIDHVVSGFFMLFTKEIWLEVGGFKEGTLGIDNYFSQAVIDHGYNIGISQNVYIWHYYRMVEGVGYKKHLQ